MRNGEFDVCEFEGIQSRNGNSFEANPKGSETSDGNRQLGKGAKKKV